MFTQISKGTEIITIKKEYGIEDSDLEQKIESIDMLSGKNKINICLLTFILYKIANFEFIIKKNIQCF